MKRVLLFFLVLGLIVVIGILSFRFRYNDYFAVSEELAHDSIIIGYASKDYLSIYVVGDSWAYYHKPYNSQLAQMIQNKVGKPVKVVSYGACGLTTKGVYRSFFDYNSKEYAFQEKPDYCIVFAGINDSDRKIGDLYYSKHMKLIVDYLLSLSVTPIILEIPEYDIVSSFESRDWQTKLFYICSMISTISRFNCIDGYRKKIEDLYVNEGWYEKVLYIHADSWNPSGYKDSRNLYKKDRMHLNENGYKILDSCIARSIFLSPKKER